VISIITSALETHVYILYCRWFILSASFFIVLFIPPKFALASRFSENMRDRIETLTQRAESSWLVVDYFLPYSDQVTKLQRFEITLKHCSETFCTLHAEADLGMFSMFGRTGASTKRGPHKSSLLQKGWPQTARQHAAAIVVCIAARFLNEMSIMTTACRVKAVRGYSYIRGPHIFSERGP